MLKIYGRANSINVRKVLWTCEEIGIPFEREDFGHAARNAVKHRVDGRTGFDDGAAFGDAARMQQRSARRLSARAQKPSDPGAPS